MNPKKWESEAERKRAYRAKRKASGNPVPRGSDKRQNGKHDAHFNKRYFISWDGEGIHRESHIDDEGRTWTKHDYTLFAASTGDYITGTKLKTRDCLALIIKVGREHPNAIHVMFAGQYDVTHILYDLPRNKLQDLEKPTGIRWMGYRIRYVPRKELNITYGDTFVRIWDTFGFFQAKFSDVIEKWLGADYPDLRLISQGKDLRDQFNKTSERFIIRYNQAELTALNLIMDKLREAFAALNLHPSRWDGAGAIAAAMMKKHDFKRHIGIHPSEVEQAARYAYFGGRFEQGLYGHEETDIHFHDINSAYPSTIVNLPSLSHGTWIHKIPETYYVPNFGLYRVRWNAPTAIFGPFGYRMVRHVYFPQRGENWVWGYELNAYLKWADISNEPALLTIYDAWYFQPHDETYKPFSWVKDYYDLRQRIVNGQTDYPNGAEKVLKLGINSIYGKTAQSVGYNPERNRTPPYYSLLYAGAITSQTRARIWLAAISRPTQTIMIATDGVFTTKKLSHLPFSDTKELGKWEYSTAEQITSIQSGIYISKTNGKWKIQSRGIDKKAGNDGTLSDYIEYINTTVIEGYKNRVDKVTLPATRIINLRAAKQQTLYQYRGYWVTQQRDVHIRPDADEANKRQTMKDGKPWQHLIHTRPNYTIQQCIDAGIAPAEQYVRPWDYGRDDDAAFLEEQLEFWDAQW